jgi:uncharacterized protein (TIGR01244 family)
MRRPFTGITAVLAAGLIAVAAHAQQVTKPNVEGIRNLSQIATTVACAGATETSAIPEVKKLGFASVINLRQASEPGVNIAEAQAAAKAAGINYIHIPFNASSPDPALADQFLEAVKNPANQPSFIHCASANRAAAMWFIKRVKVDNWETERAMTEAEALGLTSEPLKKFALDFVQARR